MSVAATPNAFASTYGESVTYEREGVAAFTFQAMICARPRATDIGLADIMHKTERVWMLASDLTANGIADAPRSPDKVTFRGRIFEVIDPVPMRDEGGTIIGYKVTVSG